MPAMWSHVIMSLTKGLKVELSITATPCSKTQSNQRPNSGNLLLTLLTLSYRIKSETVKWRRLLSQRVSGGEWSLHALVSTAPSPQHWFPTH